MTTDDKTALFRARLSDVTVQLPPSLGLIPHRSFWVAKSVLDPHKINVRKQTLALQNGTEVPIARIRKSEPQTWLDEYMLL
ncbi:LytTR family DNA-binding domain-containing protein [Yoonia tamlensis]|uniref:LytTR family DNA-binding domain-containing protein n=1 Tax=Yoonia tamlensis TaxID=390270 RepID=UPI000B7DD756|nr:LytTR family DNA-binding domain-containing protein [Yoonia tamlensis]